MKFILTFIFSCSLLMPVFARKDKPVDPNATKETINLYNNLRKLSKNHTLFGHQHTTEYGHG